MEEYKFITLNNTKLFVMKTGVIYRLNKTSKKWTLIENTSNTRKGYNSFGVGSKIMKRQRIMGYVFLNLDYTNVDLQIDHIDGNRINNNITNLRIVNNQQNSFNRVNVKGYTWHNRQNKWQAQIRINNKQKNLGYFNTEEEARQAYLNAKLIYHKIE